MTDEEIESARHDIEVTGDLPDFKVLPQLERMRSELSDGR
jgi:hypothetical protein